MSLVCAWDRVRDGEAVTADSSYAEECPLLLEQLHGVNTYGYIVTCATYKIVQMLAWCHNLHLTIARFLVSHFFPTDNHQFVQKCSQPETKVISKACCFHAHNKSALGLALLIIDTNMVSPY